MQDAKDKIDKILNEYLRVFPLEADAFIKGMRKKQDNMFDDYGSLKKGVDSLERAILEMPETLFSMMKLKLSEDEFEWFTSIKGSRWVANKYKAFSLARKV